MNAQETLTVCKDRDIRLTKKTNGRLSVEAPKGAMNDDLKKALTKNKTEVLELLTSEFYNRQIREVICQFNSVGTSMLDVPSVNRNRAFILESQLTEAANQGDKVLFADLLTQWRACFH